MKRRLPNLISVLLLSLTIVISGCEEIDVHEHQTFKTPQRGYVLACVLDMSGSFADRIHQNGNAYRFFLAAADQFFQQQHGRENRIVLAQLSATEKPLLFDGTPYDFRRKFSSEDDFYKFVSAHSDPGGSRVNAAMSKTLDYITGMHGIDPQETRLCVVTLSDMIDTTSDRQGEREVEDALMRFSQMEHAALGLYYVDQDEVSLWRDRLDRCGISQSRVEAGIVDYPDLPTFR